MTANADAAFAYDEPSTTTLLSWTGFLLALNLINVTFDKLLYCGLIGQLLIGIIWGTPGAKWFDQETETVIQKLGYLGLIMLVYEGGLSTSIKSIRANLLLSICVALTGIGAPISLSFILKDLVAASSVQAFAAGAALSATSLGTTFTILSSTGLIVTRLGTVTATAAMLDDVVGLVMIQVISNLGDIASTSFNPVTVIRPVFVSVGFAVGTLIVCTFVLGPIIQKFLAMAAKVPDFVMTMQFAFLSQTVLLVGIVAAASYAGTSSLFAAYLAGVIVSWFDEMVKSKEARTSDGSQPEVHAQQSGKKIPTGVRVYEKYYKEPVGRILIPLFFASIGFAIPITEMFQGSVVWRGVIYALLMVFGKMLTGLWLVRLSTSVSDAMRKIRKPFTYDHYVCSRPPNQQGQARSTRPGPSPSPSPSDRPTVHNRGEDASPTDSTLNEHQVPTQTTESVMATLPLNRNHCIRHLFLV
ncbi:Sodium/hydrogen exchanger family-domain-containing protein [Penicillium lividum]|nr:Sodium/hydrogen exchanger family-domain-containing protein [Penicillium lividum]